MLPRKIRGFTLTEIAIALVVMALVLGSTFTIFNSLMSQLERRETADKVATLRQALIGYAMTNGRLPAYSATADDLSNVAAKPLDFWGRPIAYIYDPQLASAPADTICARKATNIKAVRCADAACSTPIDQLNVAFLVFSTGKNLRNQTGASTNPRTEPAPWPAYSGPDGGFGAAKKEIRIYGAGIPVGDYNSVALNPVQNDDLVEIVTLEELRQKLQCQGLPLRLINVDLPVGANGAPYSVNIVAEGGVPFAAGGRYRWCVEWAPATPIFSLTVPSSAGPTPVPVPQSGIGSCLLAAESTWIQGDVLTLRGAAGANVINSLAQTYDFTVFVRDNHDDDAAKLGTANQADNAASRRYVIGVSGS